MIPYDFLDFIISLRQTRINYSTICHQRTILSFMNDIAYLINFGDLNAHFKRSSVPSRLRYSVHIFTTLKEVFSDLSSFKMWSVLHYIKIGEMKHNITDPLML